MLSLVQLARSAGSIRFSPRMRETDCLPDLPAPAAHVVALNEKRTRRHTISGAALDLLDHVTELSRLSHRRMNRVSESVRIETIRAGAVAELRKLAVSKVRQAWCK